MNTTDRINTLKLLYSKNQISKQHLATHLSRRSLNIERENLENYLNSLKKIGLVVERDGILKTTTSINPRLSDNLRQRLMISGMPNRMLAGASNPTIILPNTRTDEDEQNRTKRGRGRPKKNGGRGMKRKQTTEKRENPEGEENEGMHQVAKRPRMKSVSFDN